MTPRAPNIGLNHVFLTPEGRPRTLSPGNTYHFAVKDNEIRFKAGEIFFSIFKNQRGRHILALSFPEGSPELGEMKMEKLEPGRNEYAGLVIIKREDSFEVRLRVEAAVPAAAVPAIEPPEAVKANIGVWDRPTLRETMRDSQIAIEMARVVAEDITVINYLEIASAEKLQDGDILPGHEFVLGKGETYGRELLAINLGKTSAIHEVMRRAREIGSKHSGDSLSLALKVADMVDENYSDLQGRGEKGMLLTLGFFQEKGGCCRHRAAELQLALQEAGMRSRYVRGRLLLGWHAWVEVDVKGDGSFSYVIDPNMGIRGEENKFTKIDRQAIREVLLAKGLAPDRFRLFNVKDERRGKEEWYFVEREKFNVVWRRREPPKPVEIPQEELLRSFENGADVVRKNGVFLLRKRASAEGSPRAVFVTVVDRSAYELYLSWKEKK